MAYEESQITGDRDAFIAKQAIEWIKDNYMKEDEDFRDCSYVFVNYGNPYANMYSHSITCDATTKYLVLIRHIGYGDESHCVIPYEKLPQPFEFKYIHVTDKE